LAWIKTNICNIHAKSSGKSDYFRAEKKTPSGASFIRFLPATDCRCHSQPAAIDAKIRNICCISP
jgi:hypothetical protein